MPFSRNISPTLHQCTAGYVKRSPWATSFVSRCLSRRSQLGALSRAAISPCRRCQIRYPWVLAARGARRIPEEQLSTSRISATTSPGDTHEVWEVRGSSRQQLLPDPASQTQGTSESNNAAATDDAIKSRDSAAIKAIQGLFIPRGYPDAVTPDYLPYQYTTFFTHVTGWVESSIATSSMLKAVGVGTGVAGATAATAAMKWILKDGVGAAGRLFVGVKLSGYFDEEPRKYRMIGQFLGTMGMALEVATMIYPKSFLVLAGTGVLAKSIGKGMGKPAFRVIQQHFSRANNIGDVAAKEEVWEVVGQLSGLAATVVILKTLEQHQSTPVFLGTWALISLTHNYLRYLSLRTLRFTGLNQKRACILVSRHVAGLPVPGVDEVNLLEPVLENRERSSPPVEVGSRLSEARGLRLPIGGESSIQGLCLEEVLRIYGNESYVLLWVQGRGQAVMKEGCEDEDKVKALWQAAWLMDAAVVDASPEDLRASITAMNHSWSDFKREASAAGWDLGNILIRTPDVYIVDLPSNTQ